MKEHHREDDIIFYSYGENIINEFDLYRYGGTVIDFYHRINNIELKYNKDYGDSSVHDNEIIGIDKKIIEMKEIYNRLNLKQYTSLDI